MEERKGPELNNKNGVTRRQFLTAGGALVASAVLFNSFLRVQLKHITTSTSTNSTSTPTSTAPGTSTGASPNMVVPFGISKINFRK